MIFVHQRLAVAVILYLALAALWGLVLAARRRPMSPAYRGVLAIAEGVLLVQLLVGLVVYATAPHPRTTLHFLYGALSVLIIPGASFFAQGRREARHPLIFGIAALFLVGLAIRATTTGAP